MIEERRKRYEKELHEKYLQLYYNEQCYEELICLANFSEYGQNAWLNCLEGEYEDLFTGEKLEMNSVRLFLSILIYDLHCGILWMRRRNRYYMD